MAMFGLICQRKNITKPSREKYFLPPKITTLKRRAIVKTWNVAANACVSTYLKFEKVAGFHNKPEHIRIGR